MGQKGTIIIELDECKREYCIRKVIRRKHIPYAFPKKGYTLLMEGGTLKKVELTDQMTK